MSLSSRGQHLHTQHCRSPLLEFWHTRIRAARRRQSTDQRRSFKSSNTTSPWCWTTGDGGCSLELSMAFILESACFPCERGSPTGAQRGRATYCTSSGPPLALSLCQLQDSERFWGPVPKTWVLGGGPFFLVLLPLAGQKYSILKIRKS